METAVRLFGVLEALEDRLVFVELALLDCYINANNILPDDASGANVKMAGKRSMRARAKDT